MLADGPDHPGGVPEVAWTPPAGMPDAVGTAAQQRRMAQAVLDRRARALRAGNLSDFVMDLDRSDPEFLAEQKRLFDNLQRLPLQVFDYRVEKDTWNTSYADDQWESTAFIPFVRQRMPLQGFDRYPVETVFGVTAEGTQEAPWDLTTIRVVRGDRVLGIFDEGSVDSAETVMSAAENSIDIVSRALPARWGRSVALYALSDNTALSRLGGIPGGDPDAGRSPRIASVRVFVHPEYIEWIEPEHDVLLTHEMTHVAVARKAGAAPVWVQEGLAEHVATDAADLRHWQYDRAHADVSVPIRQAKGRGGEVHDSQAREVQQAQSNKSGKQSHRSCPNRRYLAPLLPMTLTTHTHARSECTERLLLSASNRVYPRAPETPSLSCLSARTCRVEGVGAGCFPSEAPCRHLTPRP